ncbi:hypothetical protein PV327_010706 [Microctonus hyperodae]|uniref:Rab-GAP TBC domain-containing protein n=1 Tax=Microctonus hyperodae TaxID=165561 RepID=A0AA39C811_MICHY|nr:hypothetical protein PV327_010706 [Microctonus hyperodae]
MFDKSDGEKSFPAVTNFMKSLFTRKSNGVNIDNPTTSSRSVDKIGGSLALIQHSRPPNLPAKDRNEENSHRKQHDAIIQEIKRREIIEEQNKEKKRLERLKEEEILAADLKLWTNYVIPNFDNLKNTKEIQNLWWKGLPTAIRGHIWKLGISNNLNLNSKIYDECLNKMANNDTNEILTAIKLDVSRTFPTLCVFQHGGPLFESLNKILAAYCIIYNPEIGYVQGMSFIGAILNLNMEPCDVFICFANLLNNPCHKAAFTLNQNKMNIYYKIFSDLFSINLPRLYLHFITTGLTPDFYLLEWLYTIYAKAMPLDVVCRIWDLFIRDGDEFLFRTALGVLNLYQEKLLLMDFVRSAQFLIKLPNDLDSNALFDSIHRININIGDFTFQQMVLNNS